MFFFFFFFFFFFNLFWFFLFVFPGTNDEEEVDVELPPPMPLVSTATSVGQQHNNSTDNNSVTPLANLHSQVWSVLIFSLSFCCCFFNNLVVVHRPTHFRRLFQPCHIIPWQDPSDYRFSAFFFTHSHGHVQSVGHRGFSLHFSFVFLFFFVLRGRLYRWWTFPTQHENFASMQKKKK